MTGGGTKVGAGVGAGVGVGLGVGLGRTVGVGVGGTGVGSTSPPQAERTTTLATTNAMSFNGAPRMALQGQYWRRPAGCQFEGLECEACFRTSFWRT